MKEPRDTRAVLLDAAAEEFALSGLNGARLQAIVQRARVNERMIYHHFGSKQGLYDAVLADLRTSVGHQVSVDEADGIPRETFGRAMRQIMHSMIEHPFFLPLMLHEALGGWRNSPPIAMSDVPRALTVLFSRAQRDGAFREDVRFESVYLAALGALTAGYLLAGRFEVLRDDKKRREELIDEVLELVLRGAAP